VTLNDGDDVMDLMFTALKNNTTVEEVALLDGTLSMRAELSLSSAILVHPTVKELEFDGAVIGDLGIIARVIKLPLNLWKVSVAFSMRT